MPAHRTCVRTDMDRKRQFEEGAEYKSVERREAEADEQPFDHAVHLRRGPEWKDRCGPDGRTGFECIDRLHRVQRAAGGSGRQGEARGGVGEEASRAADAERDWCARSGGLCGIGRN